MRCAEGDIWQHAGSAWIVVPTNIGWGRIKDRDDPYSRCGTNPMGVGVALGVRERYSLMTTLYGLYCFIHREATPVVRTVEGLILFPTKPLNTNAPWKSWEGPADINLVIQSFRQLAALELPDNRDVMVPLVGAGAGQLPEQQIRDLAKDLLPSDRFVLIERANHPF